MTGIDTPQIEHWAPSDDILPLIIPNQLGQELMPRLRSLYWTTGRASLPWLYRLLSPNLSVIRINFMRGHGTPVRVAVIKALPTTNLKHFDLSALHTNPEVDGALLDFVLNSKRLASISITQKSRCGGAGPPGDEIKNEREPIELGSLKSITMDFKSEPSFLQNLFNRATFPNMREINIMHLSKADWLGADEFFDSIMRLSPSHGASLQVLLYASTYHGTDITSTKIQLLQRFVALRILYVRSRCTKGRCKFFLSDSDVSAIAISMPNLDELHLGGTPCSSTVNVSINRGLAALAANCTDLAVLQIHFDAVRFNSSAPDAFGERVAPLQLTQDSCQLAKLIVGKTVLGTDVEGQHAVGMALLQIFPNLKKIIYHKKHRRSLGFFSEWEGVMRVIKVHRRVAGLD
jgi:hypothetical protein